MADACISTAAMSALTYLSVPIIKMVPFDTALQLGDSDFKDMLI